MSKHKNNKRYDNHRHDNHNRNCYKDSMPKRDKNGHFMPKSDKDRNVVKGEKVERVETVEREEGVSFLEAMMNFINDLGREVEKLEELEKSPKYTEDEVRKMLAEMEANTKSLVVRAAVKYYRNRFAYGFAYGITFGCIIASAAWILVRYLPMWMR